MMNPRDTWPERIAIPILQQQLQELDFVIGCLSEDPGQKEASKLLCKAQTETIKALRALGVKL